MATVSRHRARSLLLVAALVAISGCGEPRAATSSSKPGPTPAVATDRLRVLSYNLNFGLAGDPAGVAAVAGADADVVFLQESNDRWQRALVDALGARYPHQRFTGPHDWPAGGMGLLSRYPIVALDELPSRDGPFFAWRVELDTPGGRVQALNLHLRPPMSDSGSWVVGFFSTRDDRLREVEQHLAALAPLPTIIVGDFNEDGQGLALAHLAGLGYRDAIAAKLGAAPTWAWPVGTITLRMQLDHVLFDRHFEARAAEILDAGRSDHRPIAVDLTWIDRAP